MKDIKGKMKVSELTTQSSCHSCYKVPAQVDNQKVNIIEIKLDTNINAKIKKCQPMLQKVKTCTTRATQSIYRESSAQTLPYLLNAKQDDEEVETLELFKLKKLLPKSGPPILYEVELVERERKRWAFLEALGKNFQSQTDKLKQCIQKFKNTFKAFEWENWIAREQYIQRCQMLRLEFVIRLFNKREKEMLEKFKKNFDFNFEQVRIKQMEAMQKNYKKYRRDIIALDVKYEKNVKQTVRNEDYIPVGGRKKYEKRLNQLEEEVINIIKLKKIDDRVSRRSTLIKNIKKANKKDKLLEDDYKYLQDSRLKDQNTRVSNAIVKIIEKLKALADKAGKETADELDEPPLSKKQIEKKKPKEQRPILIEEEIDQQSDTKETQDALKAKFRDMYFSKFFMEKDRLEEITKEEIKHMCLYYESTTISWILSFLLQEETRYKIIHKLQYIRLLASRELHRREANEALCRTKEYQLRFRFEPFNEATRACLTQIAANETEQLISTFVEEISTEVAEEPITNITGHIDHYFKQIITKNTGKPKFSIWHEFFPYMMHENLLLNSKFVLNCMEKHKIAGYIIDNVLDNMWHMLASFHIGTELANQIVDRAIDNDLYTISSMDDIDDECICQPYCENCMAIREAEAILRKLLPRATPGENWKLHNEIDEILNNEKKRIKTCDQRGSASPQPCYCKCKQKLLGKSIIKPEFKQEFKQLAKNELIKELSSITQETYENIDEKTKIKQTFKQLAKNELITELSSKMLITQEIHENIDEILNFIFDNENATENHEIIDSDFMNDLIDEINALNPKLYEDSSDYISNIEGIESIESIGSIESFGAGVRLSGVLDVILRSVYRNIEGIESIEGIENLGTGIRLSSVLDVILKNVNRSLDLIPSFVEETIPESSSEFEMVINEGELELKLKNDKCKCTEEIKRERQKPGKMKDGPLKPRYSKPFVDMQKPCDQEELLKILETYKRNANIYDEILKNRR